MRAADNARVGIGSLGALFSRDPQVRAARRLRALASALSQAGHELTARRLCRKALGVLDPERADPAWSAEPDLRRLADDMRAVEISRALDRRLAGVGLRPWIASRWPRIALGAGAVAVFLALLVAAVPPLRRAVFPPDLAAGKPWHASSALTGFPQNGILAGDTAGFCCFFHTNEEPSPSFTVDLGQQMRVRRVDVTNRLDCCAERVLPLAVEVSGDDEHWTRVGYRRGEFGTWSAEFPAVDARFVRLRVDRRGVLHLRRVAVY